MRNWLNCKTRTEMCLTLKGCTGYLGHPFLHREHRGVHEEQGRGFSCREGCFSRLFPVADSAKQAARLPTDLVPRACVRHSPLPCEQRNMKKTCPRLKRSLGHVRGTEPEPTGVEFSVANFLPLPCPVWETVPQGATPFEGRSCISKNQPSSSQAS